MFYKHTLEDEDVALGLSHRRAGAAVSMFPRGRGRSDWPRISTLPDGKARRAAARGSRPAATAKFTEKALDSMNFVNFAGKRGLGAPFAPPCHASATVWQIFRGGPVLALIFANRRKRIVAPP
jgi:hypothetical protein